MFEDPSYLSLKAHLIACTGLAFYYDRDQDLSERIVRRLCELDLPDCAAYSELLACGKAGAAELEVMIERLNIGETYFFRDQEQFDAIRDVILPEILERKKASKQLRIWSAGCSNGAEPYSLAILLGNELKHQIADWDVSILATDINRRCLTEAAEGRFGEWALRSTPDEMKRQNFSKEYLGWAIDPQYKKLVSFAHVNLVEGNFSASWSETTNFDLILCRNVMIYFAPEVRRRLIHQFHHSLADGGWFLVGAVEHDLESFSSFRVVQTPGGTLYRKNETKPIFAPLPLPEPIPLAKKQVPAMEQEPATQPHIEGLRELANRGDWKNAVHYYHQLLAQDRLNPITHFYHAVVLEQMGLSTEAERSLRLAIDLDRNFLMAHHLLGLALTKEKEPDQAALSFQNVLKLSFHMPDDQFVSEGAGMTVADLKGLAKMQLRSLGIP